LYTCRGPRNQSDREHGVNETTSDTEYDWHNTNLSGRAAGGHQRVQIEAKSDELGRIRDTSDSTGDENNARQLKDSYGI
jgi:hypothetical protein